MKRVLFLLILLFSSQLCAAEIYTPNGSNLAYKNLSDTLAVLWHGVATDNYYTMVNVSLGNTSCIVPNQTAVNSCGNTYIYGSIVKGNEYRVAADVASSVNSGTQNKFVLYPNGTLGLGMLDSGTDANYYYSYNNGSTWSTPADLVTGTGSSVSVSVNSSGNAFVVWSEVAQDIRFANVSTVLTLRTVTNWFDGDGTNAFGFVDSAMDGNNTLHLCVVSTVLQNDASNDALFYAQYNTSVATWLAGNYTNATRAWNLSLIHNNTADDIDACDIEVDPSGYVYIAFHGGDNSDLELTSNRDNWIQRVQIKEGGTLINPSLTIDQLSGRMYVTADYSATEPVVVWTNNISTWNGTWTVLYNTSWLDLRYPNLKVDSVGRVYLSLSNTTASLMGAYLRSSEVNGTNWNSTNIVVGQSGVWNVVPYGQLGGDSYPSFNRLNSTLFFGLYHNATTTIGAYVVNLTSPRTITDCGVFNGSQASCTNTANCSWLTTIPPDMDHLGGDVWRANCTLAASCPGTNNLTLWLNVTSTNASASFQVLNATRLDGCYGTLKLNQYSPTVGQAYAQGTSYDHIINATCLTPTGCGNGTLLLRTNSSSWGNVECQRNFSTTGTNCTVWDTTNQTWDDCDTDNSGGATGVLNVWLNQSVATSGQSLNVTCEYSPSSGPFGETRITYYNGDTWNVLDYYTAPNSNDFNRTITNLTVNGTPGVQYVRCGISPLGSTANASCLGTSSQGTDHDDLNFTMKLINTATIPNASGTPFYTTNYNEANRTTFPCLENISYGRVCNITFSKNAYAVTSSYGLMGDAYTNLILEPTYGNLLLGHNITGLTNCSYTGGNWTIDCATCTEVTYNQSLNNNSFTASGAGTIRLLGNITSFYRGYIQSGCKMVCDSKNCLFSYMNSGANPLLTGLFYRHTCDQTYTEWKNATYNFTNPKFGFDTTNKILGSASCDFNINTSLSDSYINWTGVPTTNTGTFNAWIRDDTLGAQRNAHNLANGTTGSYFRVQEAGVSPYILGGEFGSVGTMYAYGKPVGLNTWMMVTQKFNTSGVYFYVNGTQTNTSVSTYTTPIAYKWCFGNNCVNANEKWAGQIDEITFHNRSLTDAEISDMFTDYNGGVDPFA